jgi:hypothetical protein
MNVFKQMMILTLLITLLLTPVQAFALKPADPLQQTLFLLFAEKYHPSTLSDWKSTVIYHNNLRAAIQKVVTIRPKLRSSLSAIHTEDLRAKLEQSPLIRSQFYQAMKSGNASNVRQLLAINLKKLKQRNQLLLDKLNQLKFAGGLR